MNVKHSLSINGAVFTVWGPASRMKCFMLFFKEIAKQLNVSYTEMVYALQLTDAEPLINPVEAYRAWGFVYQYIQTSCPEIIILRSDNFLSSSPSSVRPKAPTANKVTFNSVKLTTTAVSKQQSLLDGIISVLQQKIFQGRERTRFRIRWLIPQPQIIILALAITSAFGFLLLPIH